MENFEGQKSDSIERGYVNERGEFVRGIDSPKVVREDQEKEKPRRDELPVELL